MKWIIIIDLIVITIIQIRTDNRADNRFYVWLIALHDNIENMKYVL
jgi:hypothetical protein